MVSAYPVIKKTFYHVVEPEDADRSQSSVPPRVRLARKGSRNDEATSAPKHRFQRSRETRTTDTLASCAAAPRKNRGVARQRGGSTGALSTVHIKNIPCYFDRDRLCELLDSNSYSGSYDFVYLPMDFQRELSRGYAFVNFRDPCTAEAFRSAFDGFSSWERVARPSRKVLEVVWSRTQGFESNVRNLSHTRLPEKFAPLIFV